MSESNLHNDGHRQAGSPASNEARLDSTNSHIGNAAQVNNSPGTIVNNTHLTEAASPTGLVQRMLGPAADELAAIWADRVRMYRLERQAKCIKKAERMLIEAGITPQAVSPKILFPLLESASFEDNEDLHDMWAALLANAASPENASKVRPGFIAILKQRAPDEAALLKVIAVITEEYISMTFRAHSKAAVDQRIATYHELQMSRLRESFIRFDGEGESAAEARFSTCLHVLDNAGLAEIGGTTVLVTLLGKIFLDACQPPRPKKGA